ncbi:MAG: hypothetical protein PHH91_13160 [Desulfuromonadaceae bacterium]|nr:hypothetical protein [Desulfuromonadaceae bacterium]
MNRARIGDNYEKQPFWKLILGIPLVYLPLITTVPFVVIGIFLVKMHLKYVGGMDIKSYWDFVPAWRSHRYENTAQPTINVSRFHPAHYRIFWVLNCKHYCPMSVALFSYASYLVKIVENWWCPFAHDQKHTYVEGAIDNSFWHVDPQELAKLHPDDKQNPIWNEKYGLGLTLSKPVIKM